MRHHTYELALRWTGNHGAGTSDYRSYSRAHVIEAPGRPAIEGSSDPAFRGDASRYSPEDLLVASLSACHMLWYLHLCADAGVTVTDYLDAATGTMALATDGRGRFAEVVLRPTVTIEPDADSALADVLHQRAHEMCFIASSVAFPVRCQATIITGRQADAP